MQGKINEEYRNLVLKNFQMWNLTLDPIQSSTILSYELLHSYGHLPIQSNQNNVRKTLLWR